MAEEFVFDSAMMHIEGRDQFLAGAGASAGRSRRSRLCSRRPSTANTPSSSTPVATAAKNVKIAEHLVVRDGRLTSSEVVVDGAAFMAFMTG
jgi:hypothetical protein